MTELLELVCAGTRDLGADASLVFDRFPPAEPGTVFVVIPHEFYATTPATDHPTGDQLAQTIALCTEQPGTWWFDQVVALLPRMGAVMDLQQVGVSELCRLGIDAAHLPLGYHHSWDGWYRDPTRERPLDVAFIGSADPRRDRLLALYAPSFWNLRTHIRFATHEAKPSSAPGLLVGDDKRRLIGSTKIIIMPRRSSSPYFEWARALDSILNGAVVLSEHAAGFAPLVPGEHFVSGSAESLGLLTAALLEDESRLGEIRAAAYDQVTACLPMTLGAERLLGVAEKLIAQHKRTAWKDVHERVDRTDPKAETTQSELAAKPTATATSLGRGSTSRSRKALLIEQLRTHRAQAIDSAKLRGIDEPLKSIEIAATPTFANASPRVSVVIPTYQHGNQVLTAIESVAASEFRDFELLIHDDASTDNTQEKLTGFLAERPWLPARATTAEVNGGLPHTRNRLAAAARGEFLLILDADNEIWPTALARLVEALDQDPNADFAYPILQMHCEGDPRGLLSYSAWDPAILSRRNPIDALSLIRRERLLDLGGYTEDVRLFGWEDYELWCRIASVGGYGVQVPEILARYSITGESMRTLTDIDVTEMYLLLRERYPALMKTEPTPS